MSAIQTLPDLTITVNGAALGAADLASLASVNVRERLSLPALCELVFHEPETLDGDRSPVVPGAALTVIVGGVRPALFEGEVTAIELVYEPGNGRTVRIRAYDKLHRLRKRQPLRVHVQVSASDLARELVGDLGLTVDAAEAGPVHERLFQAGRTDFELLSDVVAGAGLYFSVREETLRLMTLQGVGEPVALELGRTLLEARIEMNGDPACRSVSALGWDPVRAEARQGKASTPRVGRRVSADVRPDQMGGSGERTRVDHAVQDDRHAEAAAQAELDAEVAREITLEGVVAGEVALHPGTPVDLTGVSAPFQGRFVVASVDHSIDARRGFLSEFSTRPPSPPEPPRRGTTAALAIITQVDDPEKLARVRASLPAWGDLETGWIEVMLPGAGKNKGFVALPGVGDRVLVLFLHGDPAQAVVAGGLYGAEGPADSGVAGGAVMRYTFGTPGGRRLQFDDENRRIRLEDPDGNYVEFGPERFLLHSAVDLTLEAPGKCVTVRGASVDFKRG